MTVEQRPVDTQRRTVMQADRAWREILSRPDDHPKGSVARPLEMDEGNREPKKPDLKRPAAAERESTGLVLARL